FTSGTINAVGLASTAPFADTVASAGGSPADTELPPAAAVSAGGDSRASAMPEVAAINLLYDAGADKVVMNRTANNFTDDAAGGTNPASALLARNPARTGG